MEDLSEKEQLDLIRSWWRENGWYVIGGVVLGVVLLVGYDRWRDGIVQSEVDASALYEAVMTGVADGDVEAAEAAADELADRFTATSYASQARLAMARLYMDNGRDQDAAIVLGDLLESGGDSEMRLIGRLRLAKILLYQNKPQEVIDLLEGEEDGGFAALFSEARGDAYVRLGDFDAAREAYEAALDDNPSARTVDATLVQLKLNDLPDPAELADTSSEIDAPVAEPEAAAESDDTAAREGESEQ